MSESKTPRTDALREHEDLDSLDDVLDSHEKLETELTAALQRAEKAESALCELTPGGSEYAGDPQACVEYVRRVRESQHSVIVEFKAELSRYREAEKALPEEPEYCDADGYILQSNNQKPVFVKKTAYDALRAHAAALQAERAKLNKDAQAE